MMLDIVANMAHSPNLSIVLIPGALALPEFYDPVMTGVRAKGFDIQGLHLPSVGISAGVPREGPLPNMYDDAAFIASYTEKLADQGKDVIIVAHSYGGTPATESIKGLSKVEREKKGKKGGVVKLAYMTSLVPAVGDPATSVLVDVPAENQLELSTDENGWMTFANYTKSAAITFGDIPQADAEAWAKKFAPHSSLSLASPLTYAGYKEVSVSWLFCDLDLTIPPKVQQEEIAMIERQSGKKVDVTHLKSGHCPMISQEKKTIEWLLDVAEKALAGY